MRHPDEADKAAQAGASGDSGSGETGGMGGMGDLRRRRHRDAVESVVSRAGWLRTDERGMVNAIFERGQSTVELAGMIGVRPREVRRRMHRIVKRTQDPLFVFVALNRAAWPDGMRRVATACVLHGRPLREAAHELGMSYHEVRRDRAAVEALFAASRKKNV